MAAETDAVLVAADRQASAVLPDTGDAGKDIDNWRMSAHIANTSYW